MNLHEGRTHITFDKGTCNKASLIHWVTECAAPREKRI